MKSKGQNQAQSNKQGTKQLSSNASHSERQYGVEYASLAIVRSTCTEIEDPLRFGEE